MLKTPVQISTGVENLYSVGQVILWGAKTAGGGGVPYIYKPKGSGKCKHVLECDQ